MLEIKNSVATTAVERLKKLADPLAPNRLPADPLPKAAPMSAPLPCCNKTKTINTIASVTCAAQTKISNTLLLIIIDLQLDKLPQNHQQLKMRHRSIPRRYPAS